MTTRCIRCGKILQGMAQMCDECTALKQDEEARFQTPSPPQSSAAQQSTGTQTMPDSSTQCVCGQRIPAGAAFCPICGRATGAGAMQYAGFWMRFVAALIDGTILFVVGFVIGLLASDAVAANLLAALVGFGYTVGFWITQGATPGKMAMGCRIVSADGGAISGGQAIGRYFAQILSTLLLLIGHLMIAWTPQKRGLHDYLAGTVVIKTR